MTPQPDKVLDQQLRDVVDKLAAAQTAVDGLLKSAAFSQRFRALGLRRDIMGTSWNIETALVVLCSNADLEMPKLPRIS